LRGSALDAAIQKAMSKNPFERFNSAEDFLSAIRDAMARLDQPATAGPAASPSQVAPAPSPAPDAPAQGVLKKENLFASWFKRR
jgi:hypothetical protein